jgi:hypothetical protein
MNQTVYTACLAVLIAFGLAASGFLAVALRVAAADRYRGRHIWRKAPSAPMFARLASDSGAVTVFGPKFSISIRPDRPRLTLAVSTRPPIEFPMIDSALELFRYNMDLIIAGKVDDLVGN